jgi:hypothetical protein
MAHAPERRRSQRHLVDLKVHHKDPRTQKRVFDFAKDVSETGLFIWTKRRRVVGDSFEIEFEAGDGKRHGLVKAVCKVARVTADGFAVQFVQMDADSEGLFKYYLELRERGL